MVDYTSWLTYLDNLSPRELQKAAKEFWAKLIAIEGIGELPLPSAMLSEDNDRMFLNWDTKHHHLDIDLFPNGSFDWFYTVQDRREYDGIDTEEPDTEFSERFIQYLLLIANDDPCIPCPIEQKLGFWTRIKNRFLTRK